MKSLIVSLIIVLPMMAADPEVIGEHNKRIHESVVVLREIMSAGDKAIPRDMLEHAQCVGIVPNLKRAGFIIGAKYGKGVLTCRVHEGEGWAAPSTIRVEGGSIGFQIGAGETDVVFIVNNSRGMEKLEKDKFTIGGDASVMAGPIGRDAEAETDAMMHAEILAWSRARGVFAGVSLEGATLRPDNDDNTKIYGRPVTQGELIHGRILPTRAAQPLFAALNQEAPYKKASNL
jgi:lipid-binding SYLF domain-containing protein